MQKLQVSVRFQCTNYLDSWQPKFKSYGNIMKIDVVVLKLDENLK